MIFTSTDRQGFAKSLTGVIGSAIQSVYAKPVGDPVQLSENSSAMYPLGDPWGWNVYPWNWGKEGEADKEGPTPDGSADDIIIDKLDAPPWKGKVGSDIIMFAVVIGAIWFLSAKTTLLKR